MQTLFLAVSQTVPPHSFFGYSLGEWVSLFAILSAMIASIGWVFKTVIVVPLTNQIRDLNDNINELSKSQASQTKHTMEIVNNHTEQMARMNDQLIRHDEELKYLHDERGNTANEKYLDDNH